MLLKFFTSGDIFNICIDLDCCCSIDQFLSLVSGNYNFTSVAKLVQIKIAGVVTAFTIHSIVLIFLLPPNSIIDYVIVPQLLLYKLEMELLVGWMSILHEFVHKQVKNSCLTANTNMMLLHLPTLQSRVATLCYARERRVW